MSLSQSLSARSASQSTSALAPGPVEKLAPVAAIVGHPNAGKSSVVATLTENDRIDIDRRAGTTLTAEDYPVLVDGRTVMTFVDTPGFQNPSYILEWFKSHDDGSNLCAAFIAAHSRNALFSHDCELLRPLADGAGVILVVDASKRIKEKDRVEMELLRMTGRPRMAILNNLSSVDRHVSAWQDALNKCFNAVRLFNAHRATYEERIALLNALKVIDQRWEPMLDETIRALEQDWARRIQRSARIIVRLVHRSLSHRVSRVMQVAEIESDFQRQEVSDQLTNTLREQLRRFEDEARGEIRARFHHNLWDLPPGSLLAEDLFSDDVNQGLGLRRGQMIVTGAATGAITGGAVDLFVAGLAFGTGTVLGGALGGALGYLGREALAKLDIQRNLGLARFSMGPVSNPRFPFVLLDRIILYCAFAMNWSHGRKAADENAPNRVPDREPAVKEGFTVGLPQIDQIKLAKFFADARRGRNSRHEEGACVIIERLLWDLSRNRVDSRMSLGTRSDPHEAN